MNLAARFYDVTAIGIGVFIGVSGASESGGMVFIGLCVAAFFVIGRAIED